MQCTSPVWLKERGIYVPCNHCVSCRISYSREWAVRLMNEFETSLNRGCFITLTYADEFLPEDNGLHKDDLQKFFKRLRKRLGEHKIKYYACGEYGDDEKRYISPGAKYAHGRPHYHAIIFNLSVLDASILLPECWIFGFFKIMPVFYESCKYVTGYVMKKYNGDLAQDNYGIAQPPFRLSSLGLGKSYALAHRQQIIDNLGVKQGGKNKGFPKYYQSLFERDDINELADIWTEHGGDFKSMKKDWKVTSWKNNIKDKAIERSDLEIQAYKDWLSANNPDDVVQVSSSLNFENWRRQVNKLRDLSVKAKCALYQAQKRGNSI